MRNLYHLIANSGGRTASALLCLMTGTLAVYAAEVGNTMRAIRVHGMALQLDQISVPTAAEGQVRIRVYAAGVNPFERPRPMQGPPSGAQAQPGMSAASDMPAEVSAPRMVGGDVAGVIDQVGTGVARWKVGDQVITAMQGAPQSNGAAQGSYAEYVVARATDIAPKSKKMTFEEAAGVPTVALTAWRELVVRAKITKDQKVLIHGGAGGVGSAGVQIAKAKGAYVIATASPSNHEYLKSLGADQVIDYNTTKFEDVVKDADVVLDTVGGDTATRSPAALRDGGIYVSVAGRLTDEQCVQGKVTCPAAVNPTPETVGPWLADIAKVIDAGQYKTNVFKVFPLEQAAAAQALNAERHTRGKIILSVRADANTR